MDQELYTKLLERLTIVEQSLKSEHKRLDGITAIVKSVQEMCFEMKQLSFEMKQMRGDLNSVSEKVGELEKKPAKKWDTVVIAVISAVGGCIGTTIVSQFIH